MNTVLENELSKQKRRRKKEKRRRKEGRKEGKPQWLTPFFYYDINFER